MKFFLHTFTLFLSLSCGTSMYIRNLRNTTSPTPFSGILTDVNEDVDWDGDGDDSVVDIPRFFSNGTEDLAFLGYSPDWEDDTDTSSSFTNFLNKKKRGRKHCFKSDLYCANNGRCCTHLHQEQVWCCPRKSKCGDIPNTCRRKKKK